MVFHLTGQDLLLCLVTMLKELLYDIIAKDINHQLHRIRKNFSKNQIFLVAVGCLKLLLDEPGPMLIAAELDDMFVNVLGNVRNTLILSCPHLPSIPRFSGASNLI